MRKTNPFNQYTCWTAMRKIFTKSGHEPEGGHKIALLSRRAMDVLGQPQLAIRPLKLGDDWRMIRLRELYVGPEGNRFVMQQFVVDLRAPIVGK